MTAGLYLTKVENPESGDEEILLLDIGSHKEMVLQSKYDSESFVNF